MSKLPDHITNPPADFADRPIPEQVAFLTDHYLRDPSLRGFSSDKGCAYLEPDTGNKCAVGQCMSQGAITFYGNLKVGYPELKAAFELDTAKAIVGAPTSLFRPEFDEVADRVWDLCQYIHDHIAELKPLDANRTLVATLLRDASQTLSYEEQDQIVSRIVEVMKERGPQ